MDVRGNGRLWVDVRAKERLWVDVKSNGRPWIKTYTFFLSFIPYLLDITWTKHKLTVTFVRPSPLGIETHFLITKVVIVYDQG